jgi:protoporphyrinogen/coproporphyrinogen III oxidase
MTERPLSVSRVAVLGGGITGLTAAWNLERLGVSVTVYERSARVGGAIGAVQRDGWLHELGPNSLLEGSPELAELIAAVGLADRRLYASPAAKQRFIVCGGKLVPMPTSPIGFLRTNLFSWHAKLGLLGEPWRARNAGDAEESVSNFVLRRLGREFLDYAVNPFVGGVYAGDPRRLSVQHAFPKLHTIEQEHGSLIRGAIKRRNTSGGPSGRMFSFPNGLGELPGAIRKRLKGTVHLRTSVTTLRRDASGWEVDCSSGDRTWTEAFDAVVCALPADAVAHLQFEGITPPSSLRVLGEIEHPPVASVFTGFRRSDVAHALDGFGALVPEVENGRILGTLFSSTLFPGRAPDGHVALTTFVGGSRQPNLAALNDAALIDLVQRELSRLVGITASPVFTDIQRWPRAIPQYTLGYDRFKGAINAVETSAPGLFVGGNCRDGISLSNCIASGQRLATCASSHLAAHARVASGR